MMFKQGYRKAIWQMPLQELTSTTSITRRAVMCRQAKRQIIGQAPAGERKIKPLLTCEQEQELRSAPENFMPELFEVLYQMLHT